MLVFVMPMALRPTSAAAITFDAGACILEVDVTAGGTVPLLPDVRSWTLSGGGTCHTTNGLDLTATVGGHLSGPLDQPTVGCAAAVLVGSMTLAITDSVTLTTTAAVVVGAAVVLVGVRTPDVAVAGVLVQDVAATTECIVDGAIDKATWWGPLVYGDPLP